MKKRYILFVSVFFAFMMFGETRVLFLGNSYTAGNNLPGLFQSLAEAAGHSMRVHYNAPGGHTLRYHYEDENEVFSYIASEVWDFIVIQEQSQMPVIPFYRDNWTIPYAANLCEMINDVCAEAVFFMAWAAEIGGQECIGGYCSIEFDDYFHQQDSISATYERVAELNNASCAPVGLAWRLSQELDPELGLWTGDGRHPNINGSYLAACVFFATIFQESPIGNSFHSTLDPDLALFLQDVAHDVVMTDLDRWLRNATSTSADFVWEEVGGVVFFVDSSHNANNVFWDFGDGNTSTMRNPIHEYAASGEYTVMMIAFGSCYYDTAYQTILVSSTAVVEEQAVESPLIFIPNPVTANKITIPNADYDGYELFDLTGNLISKADLRFERLIDLTNYPNGTYLLKLKQSDIAETRKITVFR